MLKINQDYPGANPKDEHNITFLTNNSILIYPFYEDDGGDYFEFKSYFNICIENTGRSPEKVELVVDYINPHPIDKLTSDILQSLDYGYIKTKDTIKPITGKIVDRRIIYKFSLSHGKHFISSTIFYDFDNLTKFIDNKNYNKYVRIIKETSEKHKLYSFEINNNTPSRKPRILIMAREYPSHSLTNYLIEGIIKKLVIDKDAIERYNWFVIPFVNPDGFERGYSRLVNERFTDMNYDFLHEDNKIGAILKDYFEEFKPSVIFKLYQNRKKNVFYLDSYDKICLNSLKNQIKHYGDIKIIKNVYYHK